MCSIPQNVFKRFMHPERIHANAIYRLKKREIILQNLQMAEISQGGDGFLLSSSQLSWAAASALLVACPGILYTNCKGTEAYILRPGPFI